MNFSQGITFIANVLQNNGTTINENNYDGLIVKRLESSNTLDAGRTTNQTHIAITGTQMDIFPYLRSDGYFLSDNSVLKKFFIIRVPIRLFKSNVDYLSATDKNTGIQFSGDQKISSTCVLRSKRKNQADQIQISLINQDGEDFIAFRHLLPAGTSLIMLKVRERFEYDVFGIKESDVTEEIRGMNNQFLNDKTSTIVHINDIRAEETDSLYEEDMEIEEDRGTVTFASNDLPEMFKGNFEKRFITSLLAKPFVILTGNSGTGKTRIAKIFAEYMEVIFEEGEKNWLSVPVGADWTDNTKIMGFFNPIANEGKGEYEETDIIKLIKRANENPDIPFFLILDEMNLSHVERYFSDFLSHMETPDIPFDIEGNVIEYPKNLFITGTVNIDETTYMFSPKVLDRANVVEFKPDMDKVLALFEEPEKIKKINPAGESLARGFLRLAEDIQAGKDNLSEDITSKAKEFFQAAYEATEKRGFEFAYRTVREIRQYMAAAYELSNKEEDFVIEKALDEQLLQKVLPKIHGNRKEIGGLLEEIKQLCANSLGENSLSIIKIDQMIKKLDEVQYASFI